MFLTSEIIKEMENKRNNLYGNFSKEEHDELVTFGLQILNAILNNMDTNIQMCLHTEFISYAIQDDLLQITERVEYVRELLLDPSVEVMADKERLQEYYEKHRKIIEMLHRDKDKICMLK